jgi:hypothetical protein
VLVATRSLPALSIVEPGDFRIELRGNGRGTFSARLPLPRLVTNIPIAPGAVVLATSVTPLAAEDVPEQPVVLRLDNAPTVPSEATPGAAVTVYGVLHKKPFTVKGVLLTRNSTNGVVLMVSKSDAKHFGTAMRSDNAVTVLDATRGT